MSLGGPPDRLLARLLDAALARGITVVAAVQPARADGGFPASHPGVLAVGAESDGAGPVDALWAPGRDIPSAAPVHAWRFVSGASFAAAHVTGIEVRMPAGTREVRGSRRPQAGEQRKQRRDESVHAAMVPAESDRNMATRR
jgi:hypothetical protein